MNKIIEIPRPRKPRSSWLLYIDKRLKEITTIKKVCEKIEDNKHQRILKCTFKPDEGHERHYHLPHFGYTLEGSTFKIKDTTGTRIVNVKTGSYFNNNGIEWHEVINIGDSTAVFLIIEPK